VSQYGYALIGFTALVAVVVGFLTFAMLRLAAGVRDTRRHLGAGSGETAFLTAALHDAVAKLKAQEQATSARAEASERLSSQIVNSLTAGLLVVDAGHRVKILNPAGRRLLGISDEPLDQDVRAIVAPPLLAVIDECVANAQPIVRRSVAMPATSRATHFGVTVSPLSGASGDGGAICLFSDLTTVFDLEEQLRIKETMARLGELTAGIAHEFRNGLATIHGYGRLIDPREVPTKYVPYVEGIRQETEALGAIVTNFLNFARPEQVTLTPVELNSVIRRAADDVRHELPEGATVDIDGQFGTVAGDEVLLRQVFANLLRNATEASASIAITPIIHVRGYVDAPGTGCRVLIDDNGPGIPADLRDKVFRPFFTTRSRGTGLGLAIVQKIVLTVGGRVAVDASPSGGARFQLTFRSMS